MEDDERAAVCRRLGAQRGRRQAKCQRQQDRRAVWSWIEDIRGYGSREGGAGRRAVPRYPGGVQSRGPRGWSCSTSFAASVPSKTSRASWRRWATCRSAIQSRGFSAHAALYPHSGALAGTPLPVDREEIARSLGFAPPTRNSLDAVSDRDFAAEYLFAATMLLSHLSRLAEDLIFYTSDEAAYAELPDSMATGSSRMPQKKNPDVLELARGHAGRAIGELTGLLAVLKGLPLAYDKDLQLDKEPLFRVRTVLALVLPAVAAADRRTAARSRADGERRRRATCSSPRATPTSSPPPASRSAKRTRSSARRSRKRHARRSWRASH